MADYNPLSLQPQIITIALVTIILLSLSLAYFLKVRKQQEDVAPKGMVLVVQIFINYIRNLVIEILGPKFEKITPFFVFLFSYILLSNLMGIVGFEPPTSSYTVTLTLAFVTWIGIFAVGIRFQKISFLRKFLISVKIKGKKIPVMINPLGFISVITPLISLSFRLWGNIFAGSLIVLLWFYLWATIWNLIPVIGALNLLGGFMAFPIHAYFDLMVGTIQALIFTMLTMIYWSLEIKEDANTKQKVKIKKNPNVSELMTNNNINIK